MINNNFHLINLSPSVSQPIEIEEYQLSSRLKSAEIKSFFGHLSWSISNRSYKKAASYNKKISLSPSKNQPIWRTAVKVENFYQKHFKHYPLEINADKLLPPRPHSLLYLILDKIRLFLGIRLSVEELFLRRIQGKFDEGYCFGVTMAIFKMIYDHRAMSSPDVITKLCMEDVAIFQMLKDLESEIQDLQAYRKALIEHPRLRENIDFLKECPAVILQESRQELIDKYQEGQAILKDLEEVMMNQSGFQMRTETFTLQEGQSFSQDSQIRAFLNGSKQAMIINMFPSDANGVGHAVLLDLEKNRFFDENGGFYEYPNQDMCIEKFLSRMQKVYPDCQTGRWEIMQVSD